MGLKWTYIGERRKEIFGFTVKIHLKVNVRDRKHYKNASFTGIERWKGNFVTVYKNAFQLSVYGERKNFSKGLEK